MKRAFWGLLTVSAILTASCGGNSEGKLLESSSADDVKNAIQYSTRYDRKRIAVEGYITFSTADVEGKIAKLDLSDTPVKGGETLLSFEIKEGNGQNCIDFGETTNARTGGYRTTVSDVDFDEVRIYDNDGEAYPLTQKVRLSGDITYIRGMDGEYTSMEAFEKGKTQYNFEFKNVRVDVVE